MNKYILVHKIRCENSSIFWPFWHLTLNACCGCFRPHVTLLCRRCCRYFTALCKKASCSLCGSILGSCTMSDMFVATFQSKVFCPFSGWLSVVQVHASVTVGIKRVDYIERLLGLCPIRTLHLSSSSCIRDATHFLLQSLRHFHAQNLATLNVKRARFSERWEEIF